MSSPQNLGKSLGAQQPRPPEERRAVPYGGDVAVARSIAEAHTRNPWTGRCRSCREAHPCPDRRDADEVLAR